MKGDFTRNTFDPRKHYARVLMQQGRVQLDADWNEQAAILLRYFQTLAADLMGPHAGPENNLGFEIGASGQELENFAIGAGRYYVQGVLCENEAQWDADGNPIPVMYTAQPDYPDPPELPSLPFLVYLDVWERHITHIQDSNIREVALGGPDTATRAKVVWQVKAWEGKTTCPSDTELRNLIEKSKNRGRLKAGVKEFEAETINPCNVSPESRYRGAENQLYRVEIHRSGTEGDATFKWSRENGSVVFPVLKVAPDSAAETTTVDLEHLGRDDRFSLQEGDWVELVDDALTLHAKAETLLKVSYVDRAEQRVILEGLPETTGQTLDLHPLLRRWDHKGLDTSEGYPELADDGAMKLEENNWLLLEDGIQIYFEPAREGEPPHHYRTGDYWLIPARTATGLVEWPDELDGQGNPTPKAMQPHGVTHHYAPLAIVSWIEGRVSVVDCRCSFMPVCELTRNSHCYLKSRCGECGNFVFWYSRRCFDRSG